MKNGDRERIGKRTKKTKANLEIPINTLTLTVKLKNNSSAVPVRST